MLGTALSEASLPFEGFGHVVLGGSGPVLIYRLAADCVRVIADVPLDLRPRVSYGNSRLDLTVADIKAASACSMS